MAGGNVVHTMTDKYTNAIDPTTGAPVHLWSVRIRQATDREAVVAVTFYASGRGGEWYTVHLRRTGGKWAVASWELVAES